MSNLRDLQAKVPRPKHSAFKAYEPGDLQIDVKYLPQMADENRRRYRLWAIDRATRWVFIRIFKAKTAANARRFLRDLERACPMRIRTILTDNGKVHANRLSGLRKRAATGEHEFDKLCTELAIEHRLTPPKSPRTNGMVERFNGRIKEVLQSHHAPSGEELEATLNRSVWPTIKNCRGSPLQAILPDGVWQTVAVQPCATDRPLQAMKDWHNLKPEMFKNSHTTFRDVTDMLLRRFETITNAIAEAMGRIGWFLILYCMIFGVSDVFMRYVLNAPSQWIGTTLQAAMVLLACVGGVYALRYESFVKLDVIYAAASTRKKAILDVLTAPIAILFLGTLIWKGYEAAALSQMLNQWTPTAVPIPIYPIKYAIPICGVLVLLIVIKNLLRDFLTILDREHTG